MAKGNMKLKFHSIHFGIPLTAIVSDFPTYLLHRTTFHPINVSKESDRISLKNVRIW